MRTAIALLCLLSLPTPVQAQESQPLAWAIKYQPVAARLSDGLVAGQLMLDTIHSWKAPDRTRAFLAQGCRLGLTLGVTELVKRRVHRERPDGSDDLSFWSGHAANATQGAGWRWQIGIPIAIGAGYLRQAANKHYVTDVLAGAGMGFVAQTVCARISDR